MRGVETSWPLYILGGGAVLVYLLARLVSRHNRHLAMLTALLLLASLAALWAAPRPSVRGAELLTTEGANPVVLRAEPGALLMAQIALILGFLVAVYSGRYLALDHRYEHYYPLLLLLCAGVTGMVLASDLFTVYLFTVLSSAAAYVLVAFRRRTETAIEAGFKYVIMSSMASLLVLTGIGLIYRGAGTLALPLRHGLHGPWGALGLGLLLFGYLVKTAVFPAHTWLPDAHGRAPSSISAMLSGIVIEAYLYTGIKTALSLGMTVASLGRILSGLAILTMTVGNVMALRQTYGKRLLGYSSIAQVGYMMAALGIGFTYGSEEAVSAGLFLIAAHAVSKGLAFLAKGVFHFYCNASLVTELDGLYFRVPGAALSFSIALAALAGVPPLIGFLAKLHILAATATLGGLGVIAAVALLANSLLSLGYYAPLVARVIKPGGSATSRVSVSPWMQWPVVGLAALSLLLGIAPAPLLAQTAEAARFLLSLGAR
ncbi:MAG: hypothetical protein FJZ90_00980 [Chloroflexi bacterium]|nr:hypothetical protein [Chloroflexota bacterium]